MIDFVCINRFYKMEEIMARVVILGGGLGGIVAANETRKRLKPEHKGILIDMKQEHLFMPSLLWLILGERKPEKIQKNLNTLGRKGIEFINAEVKKIDPSKKIVTTSIGDTDYDYLVVSLGAELTGEVIPGFKEAYNFYCLKGAILLKEELERFQGGKIAIVIASTPFRCPAAPYEAALLIDYYLSQKGLRKKTEIAIYTPETLPMPVAGPVLGNAVKEMVERRGISFNPKKKLQSIEKRELTFDSGEKTKADLIALVPPHKAPAAVRDSGLTDETGWITINGGTMETRFEDIYAIGDITANKLPNGMMLPKAGVFAHYQAEVVANNIAAAVNKSGDYKKFDGRGYCFIEMGHGIAGFASGNFYTAPTPIVNLKNPGRIWHWGKIAFEKWWMWWWF